MPINPIETTKTIESDYLAYLQSILRVKDANLTRQAYLALKDNEFVKGPFLEAIPPFVTGLSISELTKEGVASTEFNKIGKAAEITRPLYVHQEQAFRKVTIDRKNVIVATGTGSGKTECFMYPIFNELMRQSEAKVLVPGVRALLLYPMNALANDQMKRLRELLAEYKDISFGRYTSETIEKQEDAIEAYRNKKEQEFKAKNKRRGIDYTDSDLNPLPNERISRQEMREKPPHILLTNYAMLEYLLIRPEDTTFFDGDMARFWKFIVLDEAHTYKGANGTEIALLLRRLKERVCQNEKNQLQCIATSATLGNKESLPDLATFAANIFGEPFEVEDIITSERRKRKIEKGMKKYLLEDYKLFKEQIGQYTDEVIAGKWLYDKLIIDERIVTTLILLESKPKNLVDVAKRVFSDYQDITAMVQGLILLIELGVIAKPTADSTALLPARYHLFVRALEGVYVALYPEKKVFLDRKELLTVGEKTVPVFELANCQNCGQEYLIGKDKQGYLKPAMEGEKLEYYMLTNETIDSDEIDTDSDDEAFENADVKKVEPYELCTVCGKLSMAGAKRREECCDTHESQKIIKVYKMKTSKREVNTCAACGGIASAIIKRFMTANQPATYIVANSLYTMIPPKKINVPIEKTISDDSFVCNEEETKNIEYYDESGRKLLVFSDNRQEAAFFAAYMDNKYNQLMWRRLILKELKAKPDGVQVGDLIRSLVKKANEAVLYPENPSNAVKEIIAGTYLMKEYIGYERKKGLEGSGYIRFSPPKVSLRQGYLDLSAEELWELCCVFMDSMRFSGANTYPDNVNPEDETFEPRNRNVFFREENSGTCSQGYISSFLPVGSSNNKRYDYIRKILENMGMTNEEGKAKGLELLKVVYNKIYNNLGSRYFETVPLGTAGVGTRLNHKNWVISFCADDEIVYRCKWCGKIAYHNIKEVCPEFRCKGKLEKMTAKQFRDDPYYSKIYNSEKLIPMLAKEHTGQLSKDAAGSTQTKFESGEINVLSCTTTFEMGVDVGQLEAILLRNVPPETANYIQRAGRAGRRTSATAFSVTYARRNSHDLNYFENPTEIISGKIKSPYIELNNDKIASRHVNSIVLAWYFRRNANGKAYFQGNVRALVGTDGQETIVTALKEELDKEPEDLIKSIELVLSPQLMSRLGIKTWAFVNKLVGPDGTLTNAIIDKQKDLETLKESINKRVAKMHKTDDLIKLIKTFENQPTITFLAASGVIPKYGFPVDVVKLDVLSNISEASEIDLSRDLKLAISEYAPGSEVIAAGKVWTSHSINRIRDKEWPAYHYHECPDCKRTLFPDGITTIKEQEDEQIELCICGGHMKSHKVIMPIFGFSTSWIEKPKRVGDSRPKRFYPTRIQFGGFDVLDQYQEDEKREAEIHIADKRIMAKYSPQGELVIMNKGINGSGLCICSTCGYATSIPQNFPQHKNKFGHDCRQKHYTNAALGHIFASDILWLEFPIRYIKTEGKDQWTTLLYAILEGAADALGISRDDINGCIDRSGSYPVVILFDEAAGGAGHVKRIYSQLDSVLKAAYRRVDGHCKCGEETTCYGCLRSYSNQLDHEIMARGLVKEYLEWLLLEKSDSGVIYITKAIEEIAAVQEKKETVIPDEWKASLKLLMNPIDNVTYKFMLRLIEEGVKQPPDAIGYELYSEEPGVLGYEAEMVWNDKKVALFLNDNSDVSEAIAKFTESGWKAFIIDMDKIQYVVRELQ